MNLCLAHAPPLNFERSLDTPSHERPRWLCVCVWGGWEVWWGEDPTILTKPSANRFVVAIRRFGNRALKDAKNFNVFALS